MPTEQEDLISRIREPIWAMSFGQPATSPKFEEAHLLDAQ